MRLVYIGLMLLLTSTLHLPRTEPYKEPLSSHTQCFTCFLIFCRKFKLWSKTDIVLFKHVQPIVLEAATNLAIVIHALDVITNVPFDVIKCNRSSAICMSNNQFRNKWTHVIFELGATVWFLNYD